MLISIETNITCDFPVGVWTPYSPPLDLHMISMRERGNGGGNTGVDDFWPGHNPAYILA